MADVAYGDETRIRKLARMQFEELLTGKLASPLRLSRWAKAISTIKKNGVALTTPAQFSFVEPNSITLVVAPVAADEFLVLMKTDKDDADVTDANVKATGIVNDALVRLYKVPLELVGGKYPPAAARIAEKLAAHLLLHEALMGEQDNRSELATALWEEAMSLLEAYERNIKTLVNADGTPVPRKSVLRSTTETEESVFSLEDEARWGRLFSATRVDGRQDSTATGGPGVKFP